MTKVKTYFVLAATLVVAIFLLAACAGETVSQVKSAADARDAAITYLQKHEGKNAPSAGIEWQEQDITPPRLVGSVTKEFTSDEWTITVSYPVVLPENTVYEVVASSIKLGWHWKGTVNYDGSVTEVSAFKPMSKEESQRIAEEFVKNSPTFVFDGIEESLELIDTLTARCPYCWLFIFEFDSRHAGYGDRTGQILAQVITPHKVIITIERFEIATALIDEKWDMIRQEMVSEPQEKPELVYVERVCDEFMNLKHISQEVDMPVGGILTVTLCSNPSTGFQWTESAEISDQTVLEQIDHKFLPPGTDITGAPGQEVWTFKALKKGMSTVSMEYSRPWEGGEKGEWTFALTVTVK